MKLFKSLLVAPATLGLLAPFAATANEVTINDFNPAEELAITNSRVDGCLLYTSPSPRDLSTSRMPSSA